MTSRSSSAYRPGRLPGDGCRTDAEARDKRRVKALERIAEAVERQPAGARVPVAATIVSTCVSPRPAVTCRRNRVHGARAPIRAVPSPSTPSAVAKPAPAPVGPSPRSHSRRAVRIDHRGSAAHGRQGGALRDAGRRGASATRGRMNCTGAGRPSTSHVVAGRGPARHNARHGGASGGGLGAGAPFAGPRAGKGACGPRDHSEVQAAARLGCLGAERVQLHGSGHCGAATVQWAATESQTGRLGALRERHCGAIRLGFLPQPVDPIVTVDYRFRRCRMVRAAAEVPHPLGAHLRHHAAVADDGTGDAGELGLGDVLQQLLGSCPRLGVFGAAGGAEHRGGGQGYYRPCGSGAGFCERPVTRVAGEMRSSCSTWWAWGSRGGTWAA